MRYKQSQKGVKMKKAVLFDFDGVIADTEMKTLAYTEELFFKYGAVLSMEEKISYIGTDGKEPTRKLLEKNGICKTAEEFLEERKTLGNVYENSQDLKPMEGLVEFLVWLKTAGYKIGIVSSTSTRLIVTALNRMKLMSFPEVLICGDMVTKKKPSPEGYRKAMEYLEVTPEETVIIEDSPSGIQAGKAAGAYVIGYKGAEVQQDTTGADTLWKDYALFEEKWKKIQ